MMTSRRKYWRHDASDAGAIDALRGKVKISTTAAAAAVGEEKEEEEEEEEEEVEEVEGEKDKN